MNTSRLQASLPGRRIAVVASLVAVVLIGLGIWFWTGERAAARAEEAVMAMCDHWAEAEFIDIATVETKEGPGVAWDRMESIVSYAGENYYAQTVTYSSDGQEIDEWLGVDGTWWRKADGELVEWTWTYWLDGCDEYVGFKDLGMSKTQSGVEARHFSVVTDDDNFTSFQDHGLFLSHGGTEHWIDGQGRLLQSMSWTEFRETGLYENTFNRYVTTKMFSGWGEPNSIPKLGDLQE